MHQTFFFFFFFLKEEDGKAHVESDRFLLMFKQAARKFGPR